MFGTCNVKLIVFLCDVNVVFHCLHMISGIKMTFKTIMYVIENEKMSMTLSKIVILLSTFDFGMNLKSHCAHTECF